MGLDVISYSKVSLKQSCSKVCELLDCLAFLYQLSNDEKVGKNGEKRGGKGCFLTSIFQMSCRFLVWPTPAATKQEGNSRKCSSILAKLQKIQYKATTILICKL